MKIISKLMESKTSYELFIQSLRFSNAGFLY